MSLKFSSNRMAYQRLLTLLQDSTRLTSKLLAVDGLSTGAVAPGEVTALNHEVGDDTVETGAFVAEAVLASA